MAYIGTSPTQAVRTRFLYTATASQTTFSGADTQNLTLRYSDANFVDVYQNGVLLKGGGADYTATTTTSVVLTTGATADDVIEIIVYDVFAVANLIKKDGDTVEGVINFNGKEITLDADFDTSITSDTDDQIDIKIGGTDNTFIVGAGVGVGIVPTTSYGKVVQIHDTGTSGANLRLTDSTSSAGTGNGFEIIQIGVNDYLINRENGFIAIYTNGSERMKIESDGDVTITDGDLVIGTSGHGIDFSSTSDAGGMANELLDDYEEGTWTPFFGGSSGDPTVSSYATANGKYTKIGNKVYANFVCIASGTPSGGSGDLLIAGLPFALNATNTQPTGYIGIVNNITNNMSTSQLMLVGQSTSTNINVMNCSGTSTTGSNNLGVDKCHNSGARIDGTFIYTVTA
jgi:hypothetical protein